MSTEATVQVLDSAVENAGVSTVTATRTVANPRNGTVYNPDTFAAGVPVWFHRLQDGRYIAVYRNRWYDATAVYHDGPQLFSGYEEDGPCYVYIDPTTGNFEGPHPIELDTLNAAVSQGEYLFLLGTVDDDATVQHFAVSRFGGLQLQGTEVVPAGLNLGLYADGYHLHVFGSDDDGKLVRARKNWARIGTQQDPYMQWEYQGEKGWYSDPAEITPLPGYPTADGPCSMAKFRDRYYLMTTWLFGETYYGQAYTARPVDPAWKPVGDPIPLGDEDTYMGGGVYLQPQLSVNSALLPDGAASGFPYVTSVKVFIGEDTAVLTEWGILAV